MTEKEGIAEKSVEFVSLPVSSENASVPESPPEGKPMLPLNASFRKAPVKSRRVNPRLIPVKLLTFLIHGGQSATMAFVSLHMKSLGISVTEIAVVLLLMPILSSIGPPISGALADRFGNYKIVLITFTLLSAIFSTCMWFLVPSFGVALAPTILPLNSTAAPAQLRLELPCFYNGFLGSSNDAVELMSTDGVLGYLTEHGLKELRSGEYGYDWDMCMTKCNSNRSFNAEEKDLDICHFFVRSDLDSYVSKKQKNARDCTKSSVFSHHTLASLVVSASLLEGPANDSGIPEIRLFCQAMEGFRVNVNQTRLGLPACEITCNVVTSTGDPPTGVPFGNKALTISLYFVFRFLSFTSSRGVFPLLDAAVMQIAKQEGGDFGIQRLFASVGAVVVPPLAGWLTTMASRACGCADFSPAFYLFGGLTVLGAVLMYFMDIRVKKPQTHIFRTMGIVLRDPNVVAFLVAVFCSGAGWGFVTGYLFLFMEDDPGFTEPSSTFLLGLVNATGYAAGIPILYFSTQLIKQFGHENLVATVVFCYSARFLLYSFTYNPYLIFPTEIITGFTFLVFILGPQYAMKTAPKYLATLVGLFGAANFGLGGGVGPLIGGFLIHWVGFRSAFRIYAAGLAVVATVYLLIYHLVLKRMALSKNKSKLTVHKRVAPLLSTDEKGPQEGA